MDPTSTPLIYIFVFLVGSIFGGAIYFFITRRLKTHNASAVHEQVLEALSEGQPQDSKLLLAVVSFKDKLAKEVMVPRIDMFSLSAETTVKEAASRFVAEGYSRIPVYKESVDNIIGVLLYKDILHLYATDANLHTTIGTLIKPVLYTPETKRIAQLLQEFRSKHIHLAIVVDEYGGTEGILTIEDILEELVGEIADEHDTAEEELYAPTSTGGWIVDARMNILDVQEELGINIPQSPEYDTVGGYVFHKAGAIPSKGWRLHQDTFDLEVLSSNERSIDKILVINNESLA